MYVCAFAVVTISGREEVEKKESLTIILSPSKASKENWRWARQTSELPNQNKAWWKESGGTSSSTTGKEEERGKSTPDEDG